MTGVTQLGGPGCRHLWVDFGDDDRCAGFGKGLAAGQSDAAAAASDDRHASGEIVFFEIHVRPTFLMQFRLCFELFHRAECQAANELPLA